MSIFDNFAQGMNPFATRLILGDFEFLDFEVPERVALGAKQQAVVHKLVGGVRVVDVLGIDYDAIRWNGIITGPNAGERVHALERLRDAGKPLTFTLDDYSFQVVLAAFDPVYEFVYRRPYSLELTVISRNDAPVRPDALTGSLDALVNSDLGKALGLSSVIDVQAVTDAVASVQEAMQKVQDFANATVQQIQSVVRPIIAAQQIVQKTIATVEASVYSIASLGGIVPGNPVAKTVVNIGKRLNAATQVEALYKLGNVLGTLNKNVGAGQAANGIKTVTQSGGNLYQVASSQYGDPSKWTSIAAANKTTDPQISGIQTVVVPTNPS